MVLSAPLPPPARFLLWVRLWVNPHGIRLLEIELALSHPEHKIALHPSYLGRYPATLITACFLSQLIFPIYMEMQCDIGQYHHSILQQGP